jgi:flagellar hook protein FlgE
MSFYGALASSSATLASMSAAFEAISENIINSQTVGFKSRVVEFFAEENTQPYTTAPNSGSGASSRSYYNNDRPSPIIATKNETDFAIDGSGFFITQENLTGGKTLLTANGSFERYSIDKGTTVDGYKEFDTYFVDKHGHYLLGWTYDQNTKQFGGGTLTQDTLEPINIRRYVPIVQPAKATTELALDFNIPATEITGDQYQLQHRVFDGTGTKEIDDSRVFLKAIVTKTNVYNQFEFSIEHAGFNNRGQFAPRPQDNIIITFNADGSTIKEAYRKSTNLPVNISSVGFTIPNLGGSTNSTISYDLRKITNYDQGTLAGSGKQLVERETSNNGNPYRIIHYRGTEVSEDGTVTIRYTHDIRSVVAKIPYGRVFNPRALTTMNGPTLETNENSGPLQVLQFSSRTNGQTGQSVTAARLSTKAVNGSTTNITKEFSNMIVAQRAYNSATTALRTIDEMIKKAADIKG